MKDDRQTQPMPSALIPAPCSEAALREAIKTLHSAAFQCSQTLAKKSTYPHSRESVATRKNNLRTVASFLESCQPNTPR